MRNYGLPYKGSKNAIADLIVEILPPAEHFYDVFGGGGAVTHAAMLSGKWKHYHLNDITDAPKLFYDAVKGRYRDERRWISRDDFFRLKDTDPYVRICWSFGNGGKNYMYSREIEPYKRAMHRLIVFGDTEPLLHCECEGITKFPKEELDRIVRLGDTYQRRLAFKSLYRRLTGDAAHLQSLERLERLQRLQSLQSLEISRLSYDEMTFETDSVIYCDPPYRGTEGYGTEFDFEKFDGWAKSRKNIFISEYSMPDDFDCVYAVKKNVTYCATATGKKTERLFVPKAQRRYIPALLPFTDIYGMKN